MDIEELQAIGLLAGLPESEQASIAPLCNRATVMPGTYLVKAGDHGYHFFGILHGSVTVSDGETEIATLNAGDVFGEMALLEDHRRNANVVAGRNCELLTIMSWDFRDAINSNPEFKAAIDRLTEERSG